MREKLLIAPGILLFVAVFLAFYPMMKLDEKSRVVVSQPDEQAFSHFEANGLVTNIWLSNASKLDEFRKSRVRYLIVDIGDTGSDGRIKTPIGEIRDFINMVSKYERQSGYDFVLIPYSEINTNIYTVNSSFMNNFVKDYVRLNRMGFDGVHVDMEPVKPVLRKEYISLLLRLNKKLPKGAVISVYSGSISDSQNEWEWSPEFYELVSENTDIILMQGYDFGLESDAEYKSYLAAQIENISARNWSAKFLMGVPTHKSPPESVDNAMYAYHHALNRTAKSPFVGVAVFAEWTTSEEEWKTINMYLWEGSR